MYEENPDTLPSFSYIKTGKELENYCNKECAEHPINNHCKIFCD